MKSLSKVLAQEEEAWDAIRTSDWREALSLLMDTYGEQLFRFCVKMVRDPELARDVHQITFVQAWKSLERFKGGSSLRTWLYGIARHRCLDALKARQRRQARFQPADTLPEVPADELDAEGEMEQRSLSLQLEECIDGLPAHVKEAVLLRYSEGLSYPEISRICGERPPTLQARVARALPRLRRCLGEKGVEL